MEITIIFLNVTQSPIVVACGEFNIWAIFIISMNFSVPKGFLELDHDKKTDYFFIRLCHGFNFTMIELSPLLAGRQEKSLR